MKALARLVLGLIIFDAAVTAPTLEPINYDSETYDATVEDLDNLYNYENIPIGRAEIEIATVMPSGNRELLTPPPQPEEAEEEEEESTPRLIDGSSPQEPEFTGVLGPNTNEGQNNNIWELHENTFCDAKNLTYIRKALEDIRLDGNPINLSKTPQAYMCLPRLPIGSLV
ncbi:epiphycan [Rhinolophus sinicus]|uniref:epiphycan n=1 Tax=Rhinolophus sinicus TaxID=89399 RepID=UPI003D793668